MASNQENSNEMKIIHLRSKDGVIFDVDLAIAKRSLVVQAMIDNLGVENCDEALPLHNVTSDILRKVIEFATHHKNDPMPNDDRSYKERSKKTPLTEWDKEFLTDDINIIFQLVNAANYLDMKDLIYLGTQAISTFFNRKDPKTITETLHLLTN